jgi:hypothetical protein
VQQGAVELTTELAKGRYIRGRKGDPAYVRVEWGELQVAVENRKKPRQIT